ncbi:YeiH family protein [Sphingorhabdus sp.]|uniref:YeiH family protein n=1 Tax=Sphingorhabdus sp. TaxID=1902408 RepID=UPI00333F127C
MNRIALSELVILVSAIESIPTPCFMLELPAHVPIDGYMTPQDINANYIADLYGETYLADDNPPLRKRLVLGALFPGFAVVAIASVAATWFSEHYGMPVILAGLLLGLALNFVSAEQKVHPGLDFCGTVCLRWGIVLLGTQVTAMQIGGLGALAFLGLIGIMSLVMGAGLLGARLSGQSNYAGWLAGGATAICGASAALAIYAVIGRERLNQSQFTLTLVGVALASAVAMSFYPIIAAQLAFTDKQAGFLMGAAIHDVAQALGGGYSFSQSAGETATIVKLSRVALLAPAVALIGLAIGSSDGRPRSLASRLKLPWFILAFFATVAINSAVAAPAWVAEYGLIASKAMLLFAVTATAMRSRLDLLLSQGTKALFPVILATLTAFLASAAFAWAFL